MNKILSVVWFMMAAGPLMAMDFVTQMDWDKQNEFKIINFKAEGVGGTALGVKESPGGLLVQWPGVQIEAEVIPPEGTWELGLVQIRQGHYSSRAWKDIVIREIYPRLPQNAGDAKSFPWAAPEQVVKGSGKKPAKISGTWRPQVLAPWQGPLKDGGQAKEESLEVVNQELGVEIYLMAWQKRDPGTHTQARMVFLKQVRFSTAGYALVDCQKPLGQRVQELRPAEVQLKVLEREQIVFPEGRLFSPPAPGEGLQLFYNYEFWK